MPPFQFPHDVAGWLNEAEGRLLAFHALGLDVLEIGSYCGRSTICLAQTAKSVVSVDPHDGRGTPEPRDTHAEFVANIERYGCRQVVTDLRWTIAEAQRHYRDGHFAFIFIDGAHDYESVRNDITHALRLLAPGGLLAFHDYRCGLPQEGFDPGVEQAVNELLATRTARIVARAGSVAIIDPGEVKPMNEIKPLTQAKTCGGCAHWHKVEADANQRLADTRNGITGRGECRRFPPQYTAFPTPNGQTINTVSYPILRNTFEACAEHDPAPVVEARSPLEV
jgi:SAM-dependent methyltransferase